MKERIKKILKDYPRLYNFTQKLYWKVQIVRANIFGTSLIEKKWINRSPSELSQIYHPHRKFLVDKISLLNPQSILEIGCGWGPNLFLLAEKFPNIKIVGIDINLNEIKQGQEFFKNKGVRNIELKEGKADELFQFSDKSFDIVLTDAVLMYLGPDKIERVIKEMIRIAKKALVLVEWHIFSEGKDIYDPHIGVWKRDYLSLLNKFFPKEKIFLTKITEKLWPDEDWTKFGYLIEVKL